MGMTMITVRWGAGGGGEVKGGGWVPRSGCAGGSRLLVFSVVFGA